jgi:GT2 family glycosyltransferase
MNRGRSIRRKVEATDSPRVAVVIAAYESYATIGRCLEALGSQTFQDFETIVVDSSPNDRTAGIVEAGFPEVDYWYSPARLLPHAARNEGVRRATAPVLVFTDPDIYADPDWLEQMVGAHDETGGVIVGAIDCAGRRWHDRGIHITKFSKWLPGGERRDVDMGPTATLLVRRTDYDAVGGFSGDLVLGDVGFSTALRALGRDLIFEPRAVVEHHHTQSFRSFIRERWTRGIMYGKIRAGQRNDDRLDLLGWFLVTALPVRFARNSLLVFSQCARASRLGELAVTAPIVVAGYMASLAGEALAYVQLFISKGSRLRA